MDSTSTSTICWRDRMCASTLFCHGKGSTKCEGLVNAAICITSRVVQVNAEAMRAPQEITHVMLLFLPCLRGLLPWSTSGDFPRYGISPSSNPWSLAVLCVSGLILNHFERQNLNHFGKSPFRFLSGVPFPAPWGLSMVPVRVSPALCGISPRGNRCCLASPKGASRASS